MLYGELTRLWGKDACLPPEALPDGTWMQSIFRTDGRVVLFYGASRPRVLAKAVVWVKDELEGKNATWRP